MRIRIPEEPRLFSVEHEFPGWTLFGQRLEYKITAWFKRVDDEEYAKGHMYTRDSKDFLMLCWHDSNFKKVMESTGRFFLYAGEGNGRLQEPCGVYQFTDYEKASDLVRDMEVLNVTQDFTEYPDAVPTLVRDRNCSGLAHDLARKDFRLSGCELQGPIHIDILPPGREILDENVRRMGEDTFMELKSALADLNIQEYAVIAAYHEIFEIKQRHLEREWVGSPDSPLRITTRSVEDGIEISWNWQWNDVGTKTLLGFRSEGGFSGNDYKEDEGSRVVDNQNPSGSTIDYLQEEKTYYYKFFLRNVFEPMWPPFTQETKSECLGLVKFSIRLPRRLEFPDPRKMSEETYRAEAKIHLAGAEAIRARAQFEREKQALKELLKPQEESSKEARIVTQEILRGLDEAFEREREREVWYGERLKKIADAVKDTKITQEQAERLEQFLYDLHVSGNL